jgi:hypothetical protein
VDWWLSPQYKVVFSAGTVAESEEFEAVFDAPENLRERFLGARKSLPRQSDRMEFVNKIAEKFNGLMQRKQTYLHDELLKIRKWTRA